MKSFMNYFIIFFTIRRQLFPRWNCSKRGIIQSLAPIYAACNFKTILALSSVIDSSVAQSEKKKNIKRIIKNNFHPFKCYYI